VKYRRLLAGLPADPPPPPPPPPAPRKSTPSNSEAKPDDRGFESEEGAYPGDAREIKVQQWTPAEIDQLRRRLLAEHGEAGKAGSDYIADVLQDAGQKVVINQQEEAEEQYEEEFEIFCTSRRSWMPKSASCAG